MTAGIDNAGAAGGGGGGFGAQNWATLISAAGQGAASGLQGASQYANSKAEAKEAKRRTIADLLNRAMKRDMAMFRTSQDHADEGADYQSQLMQQIAKGFVDSLRGSSISGRQ